MSSAVALVCMIALLLAASGLLLWRRARDAQEHTLVDRFVDRQTQAGGGASGVQPGGMGSRGRSDERMGERRSQDRRVAQRRSAERRSQAAGGRLAATPLLFAHGAPDGLAERLVYACALAGSALHNAMNRAGIVHPRVFLFIGAGACLLVSLWATLRAGPVIGAAIFAIGALCVCVLLSWLTRKRHQRISRQLPVFLDSIVRLITIGNSVPAAFQAALLTAEAPLRECLDRVSRMLRSGIEIDQALTRAAQADGVREFELLGVVLRISVKYGGRSDVMLDRMSALMRDLEHADRELVALSTETRLSAWVLSVLPLLIGGFVIVSNPRYFHAMWDDPFGQKLVYAAFGLQVFGAFLLYRLSRLRS